MGGLSAVRGPSSASRFFLQTRMWLRGGRAGCRDGSRTRGAVVGLELGRSGPLLCSPLPGWGWKARGRLLAPGVRESQACGREPMFPKTGSSPVLGGWVGPLFSLWQPGWHLGIQWHPPPSRQWGLALACPTYSPAQLPPHGRLGCWEGWGAFTFSGLSSPWPAWKPD